MTAGRYGRGGYGGGGGRRRSVIGQVMEEIAQHSVLDDLEPFPSAPLPGGPKGEVVLEFSAPATPVSVNEQERWHWTRRRPYSAEWQNAAYDAAEAQASDLAPFRGHRVEITVAIPVPDRRARDPHNYVSTVVKPLVDGLVRTGLLVPDDNSIWAAVPEPVLWRGHTVRVRIRVAAEAWDPAEVA